MSALAGPAPPSRRRQLFRAVTLLLPLAILWHGAGAAVSAALARSGDSGQRDGGDADARSVGQALLTQHAQEESDHKRRRRRAGESSQGRSRRPDESSPEETSTVIE